MSDDLTNAAWYYLDEDKQQVGPVVLEVLKTLWRDAQIDGVTMVCFDFTNFTF
jgi:hypothetical protein